MKKYFKKLHWFLSSQMGLDFLILIKAFRGIPIFLIGYLRFIKIYSGEITLKPCLNDRFALNGAIHSEYFWQDLLVAQLIFDTKPRRHVDIGSRIDGFVAHLATFREVEVFDIRPMGVEIPNILFKQADIMDLASLGNYGTNYCDSLSCLHAIEHFGLGRYGDPIEFEGYKEGLKNMLGILDVGGNFYLSTPIGRAKVEFNANYIFDPREIISIVESSGMIFFSLMIIKGGSI